MLKHTSALILAAALLWQVPAMADVDAPAAYALTERTYTGVAQRSDGTVAYKEHHRARFDANGRIIEASTDYVGSDGEVIARLNSDFTASLTAPSHTYEFLRSGAANGIRVTDEGFLLFNQKPGEAEEQRMASGFSDDALVVGCQGLHYYLRENLPTLVERGKIPIKFLIPGKLKVYDFEMLYAGTNAAGHVNIDIVIKNRLLRLVAPSLNVVYDSNSRDLLSYQGLSNIKDEQGKPQTVTIEYDYEVS
jgi:hypothetical protein